MPLVWSVAGSCLCEVVKQICYARAHCPLPWVELRVMLMHPVADMAVRKSAAWMDIQQIGVVPFLGSCNDKSIVSAILCWLFNRSNHMMNLHLLRGAHSPIPTTQNLGWMTLVHHETTCCRQILNLNSTCSSRPDDWILCHYRFVGLKTTSKSDHRCTESSHSSTVIVC